MIHDFIHRFGNIPQNSNRASNVSKSKSLTIQDVSLGVEAAVQPQALPSRSESVCERIQQITRLILFVIIIMGCSQSKDAFPITASSLVDVIKKNLSRRRMKSSKPCRQHHHISPRTQSSSSTSSILSVENFMNAQDEYVWKANVKSRELSGIEKTNMTNTRSSRERSLSQYPDVFSIFSQGGLSLDSPTCCPSSDNNKDELSNGKDSEVCSALLKLEGETFSSMDICYGMATLTGPVRPVNEDRHICTLLNPEMACFGIFDGHGGSDVAEYLSHHLHHYILTQFKNGKCGELKVSIQAACRKMDDEIFTRNLVGGSTAILAVLTATKGVFASIGDSQVVLSVRGIAHDVCAVHKPTGTAERRRIEKAKGVVTNGRIFGMLGVSRAFGDNDFKTSKGEFAKNFNGDLVTCEPDIIQVNFSNDVEFAVLGCDGLFDVLTPQEVINFIRHRFLTENDVTIVANELTSHACKLGTTDNVSVIIVALPQQQIFESADSPSP